MSRYLEEAAQLLRKAAADHERACQKHDFSSASANAGRERIAREFAVLAAIDKGLLPAELTETVLEQIRKEVGR